jgi:folate-binding protein YgfZ
MNAGNEYLSARNGAGMTDLGARGRLVVRGSDRKTFLHALLTNDIALLSAGTGCYAALLTPQGRMIADMNVFELGDVMLIDVRREVKDILLQRFDQLIFTEDVQLGDVSDVWGCIGVYGPQAAAVAGGAVGADLSGFSPFQNARLERGGELLVVARRDALGLTGFLLFGAGTAMPGIAQALHAGGAAVLEAETVEALRIEAGEPAFLVDMGDDTIPSEAGIEAKAVSYLKGCFPGQEVLVRIRDRGHGKVVRKLVGLTMEGAAAPAAGSVITGGEKEIGRVTSSVVSPALGKPIALGYVHRDFIEPGTGVIVVAGDLRLSATVTDLPFVRCDWGQTQV